MAIVDITTAATTATMVGYCFALVRASLYPLASVPRYVRDRLYPNTVLGPGLTHIKVLSPTSP